MFKIKYKDLRQNSFHQAMVKLATCTTFGNVKVTYNVMRMAKALEKELSTSQKIWSDLLEKLVKKKEDGSWETDKGQFVFKDGLDPEASKKELEGFHDMEIEIDRFPLKIQDLVPAQLCAADMAALEPMLDLEAMEFSEGEGKILKQIK